MEIFTIGHSARSEDEFVGLLIEFGIRILADVRTIPKSRKNPQFGGGVLSKRLHQESIRYVHLPKLGGLRKARKDSPNQGWRNPSFRGYADHMQTPEFEEGLEELLRLETGPIAIMCAEAVPWRCHRFLIADMLLARGIPVTHILGPGQSRKHTFIPFGKRENGHITYPSETAG